MSGLRKLRRDVMVTVVPTQTQIVAPLGANSRDKQQVGSSDGIALHLWKMQYEECECGIDDEIKSRHQPLLCN